MPAGVGQTYGKHGHPSDLHSSRRGKDPVVGTSPLGGTKWGETVLSSILMGTLSLGKPIGRSGDHTQPVPSLRVLPYGTLRNRKWTIFCVSMGFGVSDHGWKHFSYDIL
jgi:hypothetical protein